MCSCFACQVNRLALVIDFKCLLSCLSSQKCLALVVFFVLLVSQECLALVVDFMCFCLARQVKSGGTQGSPRYFVRFVHFGAVCLCIHSVSLPVFCVNC